MTTKAYRAHVDSQRFAVVHATDLLAAGEAFKKELPDVPCPSGWMRLHALDDREPEGSVKVHQRMFPLTLR